MDAKDHDAEFFSALTTEHFVMQSQVGATLSEAQSRAGMFLSVLTGALIAMGFTMRSLDVLLPFVATVLPAVFVMGVVTVLRLTDISIESSSAYIVITKIRRHYRSLGPQAATFFEARLGRWPENSEGNPATRLGSFIAYWTSAAAMIAAIDALVGAAAITLLLKLGAGAGLPISLLAGAALAVVVLFAFFYYQKLRIIELVRLAGEV
jgi:hypothetical protein